jgi:hypothetical protein
MIVLLGRIHALTMVSNVSAEPSAAGSRQVSPIPIQHRQRLMTSHAICRNYIFLAEAALIYFHIFAIPHPPPSTIRKAVKNNSK